ncbi:MAG: ABC transporter [Bacteroidetes bacterium CG2_30_33_31]|nr:MAG: ABC transporter [Bacteroidetes bacterium CG2_30_33_31]
MNSLLLENVKIATESIKSHRLRTILTMLIIAFGIMALVGILTAIDSIKGSINENFQMMGSNTFSITNRQMIVLGEGGHNSKNYLSISYNEALEFKKRFSFPGICSLNAWAKGAATLKYREKKTNPNIGLLGIDNNYLRTSGMEIEKGRNFTPHEMTFGSNALIIGSEIATTLFGKTDPVGKIITLNATKYKVVGVLKAKGSSMGFGGDRNCFISLSHLRQKYYRPQMNFTINYMVSNQDIMSPALDEAQGLFRVIRRLTLGEEDNFTITKSDSIAQLLIENLKYVTLAAIIIALITLLGASVGLMNIMLVSVSERTREIGVRKALGANNKTIKNQFLIESVVITELGGILGIIFGISLGNLVSHFTGGSFVVPWIWILVSLFVSLSVGLISGLYPAVKAAKLSPIESLRFE